MRAPNSTPGAQQFGFGWIGPFLAQMTKTAGDARAQGRRCSINPKQKQQVSTRTLHCTGRGWWEGEEGWSQGPRKPHQW
eukprot:m.304753 g.304753  ORF g.304753 m.304753 type:complete len:79 (-) comp17274_c0_seq1:15-251(-)